MFRLDSKNVNFSGASIVNNEQIASMSASHSNNYVNFSFSIEKLNLYNENAETVEADFEAFKETVLDSVNN